MAPPSPRSPGRIARALRVPGYLILGLVAIGSITDLLANVSPLLPRLVAWRVRALGLTANSLFAPLLALLLLYALTLLLENRVVLRILVAAAAVGALALVVGSGILALDAVELRRSIPPLQRTQFAISAVYALVKFGLGIACLSALTWVGVKADRAFTKAEDAALSKPNLLIRTPSGGARAAPADEPAAVEPPVA